MRPRQQAPKNKRVEEENVALAHMEEGDVYYESGPGSTTVVVFFSLTQTSMMIFHGISL